MRMLALTVALLMAPVFGPPAVRAQGDVAAIEPVMRQLEALRRDDYDAAYAFASEEIQGIFDRHAFEQMVKTGYPEIARSASAHVAESRGGPDGHVFVRVKIRGANGNSIEAVYDMVQQDGRYRINGVVTRPDPGVVTSPDRAAGRAT